MKQSSETRNYNAGKSDYAKHKIQPWDIWKEYNLNPWDADIVKRVLRTKEGEERSLDYEKIIHICKERIRQLADTTKEAVDIDGTTVFCPTEEYKPKAHAFGDTKRYRVYSVFKEGDSWYAYLGYYNPCSSHMYARLTGGRIWGYTCVPGFPKSVILLSECLLGEYHAASIPIGAPGADYNMHDYLINEGKLYRYFGCCPEGFKYYRFADNVAVPETHKDKLINDAMQVRL